MLPSRRINGLMASALLLTFGVAQHVRGETTDCTPIQSLPTTISAQGIYCFVDDLTTNATTGNAIEITTSNVTIDMNGWKLGGLAAGLGTTARGIASNGPNNITIRNGNVRGYLIGVELLGGQGHVIEDVRAERNRQIGLKSSGNGVLIRRNQVVDTGGSTAAADASIWGMEVLGSGPRVLGNDVSGVTAAGNGDVNGIRVVGAANAIVSDNRVTGISASSGDSAGILIGLSEALVANNIVSSVGTGLDTGVNFVLAIGGYRDNIVSGAATAYAGLGTDLGNNDDL